MPRRRKDFVYRWDLVPVVVDVPYAANVLRVSPRTVYDYCRKGLLKAAKTGKLWTIPRENLMEFCGVKKEGENEA